MIQIPEDLKIVGIYVVLSLLKSALKAIIAKIQSLNGIDGNIDKL